MTKDSIPPRTKILFVILVFMCGVYIYYFRDINAVYDYSYAEVNAFQDILDDEIISEIKEDEIETKIKDSSPFVRKKCAEHPLIKEEHLLALAKDEDIFVKRSVAINPNTTQKVLSILALDKDSYVKKLVIRNPRTDKKDIYAITENADITLQWELARSVHFDNTIWEMWKDKNFGDFMNVQIASNPNCPTSILDMYAENSLAILRRCVAENIATTKITLKKLANDSDSKVALAANINLKTKE